MGRAAHTQELCFLSCGEMYTVVLQLDDYTVGIYLLMNIQTVVYLSLLYYKLELHAIWIK